MKRGRYPNWRRKVPYERLAFYGRGFAWERMEEKNKFEGLITWWGELLICRGRSPWTRMLAQVRACQTLVPMLSRQKLRDMRTERTYPWSHRPVVINGGKVCVCATRIQFVECMAPCISYYLLSRMGCQTTGNSSGRRTKVGHPFNSHVSCVNCICGTGCILDVII